MHNTNVAFIKDYLKKNRFDFIDQNCETEVEFFRSGGGTHLYLIRNGKNKLLFRINFYPGKNLWGTKKQEYTVLKLIETMNVAPKAYHFNSENLLEQHFTIVEYIEGDEVKNMNEDDIVRLVDILKKIHSIRFNNPGYPFPPDDGLPYESCIYDDFALGEDKNIEKYSHYVGIDKVISKYNNLKSELGTWFKNGNYFIGCNDFRLCHADLKIENFLRTKNGIVLIDWEYSSSDILESDIGRVFSGFSFTDEQEQLFLRLYFGENPDIINLKRVYAIKMVLDFFKIIEDYILLKRMPWNADEMLKDLLLLEFELKSFDDKFR